MIIASQMRATKALTSLFSLQCGACKTCSIVAQWNLVWNPPKNQAEVVFMDVWSLYRHSVTWKSSRKYWQIILMHLSWVLDTTVVLMMCFVMFSLESVWRYLVYDVFDCLTYVNFVWPMSALFVCLFQDNRRTSTEMFGTATRVYSLQPFTVSMAVD